MCNDHQTVVSVFRENETWWPVEDSSSPGRQIVWTHPQTSNPSRDCQLETLIRNQDVLPAMASSHPLSAQVFQSLYVVTIMIWPVSSVHEIGKWPTNLFLSLDPEGSLKVLKSKEGFSSLAISESLGASNEHSIKHTSFTISRKELRSSLKLQVIPAKPTSIGSFR